MAGSSLLALIDDVATLLDDVAILTKVAAKQNAGVLGDDLALNAQQVSGVIAHRELPVIWAVAKGSALNMVILVPAALLIRALAPWATIPLMMVGGPYLCSEGVEKLAHRFLHRPEEAVAHHAQLASAAADPKVDMVAFEKAKIRGAIRTDREWVADKISSALRWLHEVPSHRVLPVDQRKQSMETAAAE